jgi:hypothetical protein
MIIDFSTQAMIISVASTIRRVCLLGNLCKHVALHTRILRYIDRSLCLFANPARVLLYDGSSMASAADEGEVLPEGLDADTAGSGPPEDDDELTGGGGAVGGGGGAAAAAAAAAAPAVAGADPFSAEEKAIFDRLRVRLEDMKGDPIAADFLGDNSVLWRWDLL